MVRIISHRGNLFRPEPEYENTVENIEDLDFYCPIEIDVWYIDGKYLLGHDRPNPNEEVSLEWLEDHDLYVHAKNKECFEVLSGNPEVRVFSHDEEESTVVSDGTIWCHSKFPVISERNVLTYLGGVTSFLHEFGEDTLDKIFGVCTDYPYSFLEYLKSRKKT